MSCAVVDLFLVPAMTLVAAFVSLELGGVSIVVVVILPAVVFTLFVVLFDESESTFGDVLIEGPRVVVDVTTIK